MKNLLSKIKTFAEDNPHFLFSLFAFILTITALVLCFALPSSAADESSEGGGSSSPTDLTGSTWNIPAGWLASSGFAKFNITGRLEYNGSSSYFTELQLGYRAMGGSSSYASENNICVNNDGKSYVSYSNAATILTLRFFSGDVTNTTLISWLMSNGTWTNPPEPEPTPTYTIPAGSYLINETTDIPPLLSPYTYTSRFTYDGKVYTNLVFNRQGIFFIDESGDHLGIYQRANVNNPWSGDRNFTLLTEIVTEDEELYNYFINNTQPYEPDVFDVVVYFISGFFKALDKFVIFYNFSLLDFIFVMCGLLAAIWFLKVLAGG